MEKKNSAARADFKAYDDDDDDDAPRTGDGACSTVKVIFGSQ